MAFLYLTEPRASRPARDAVVYCRRPPEENGSLDEFDKRGAPPGLTAKLASASAVIEEPKKTEFTFQWSTDGESVAVLRNGIPIAMATSWERIGYSKAVVVASSVANPWSESRFHALFRLEA